MMTWDEYMEACFHIEYEKVSSIGEFGQPMNCYGFVYWYYRLCRGIMMDRDGVECIADVHRVRYQKVGTPVDGDVVDIRTIDGVRSMHVGILMGDTVYHFNEQGLQSKNMFRMLHSIKGFYHVIED